jgi:hypothetical protein
MNRILIAFTLVLSSLLAACSDSNNNGPQVDQGPPNPFAGFVSTLYSGGDNWLCHPALTDTDNVCASNLDATLVFADGSTEIEPHNRAADPGLSAAIRALTPIWKRAPKKFLQHSIRRRVTHAFAVCLPRYTARLRLPQLLAATLARVDQ